MDTQRHRLQEIILAFLLMLTVSTSADSFTMKLSGYFFTAHSDVRLTLHVPYRDENRSVTYEWLGENNDGGSSLIELVEGDHVTRQVTFERWIKHNLEGHHTVQAVLHATDGDRSLSAEFEVR